MAKSPNSRKDVGVSRPRRKKEKLPRTTAAVVAARNREGRRARLEGLAALISDGLIAVGRDERCTYVNPAAARFLRRRTEDLVGRPLGEVFPEVRHTLWEAGFRRIAGGRGSTTFEIYCVSVQAWFECRCHPSLDGVNLLFTDVTERRRAADALRESERRLRVTLEGGRMGRWEWDLRTDAMSWCERVQELLGLDRFRKAPIQTLLDRIHPEDRDAVKTLLAKVLTEGTDFEAEFRVLYERQERWGGMAWLAARAKVVRDGQGRAVQLLGVMHDVTQRKEMEAELRRLKGHLEEEVQAHTEELRSTVERLQDEVVRRVLAEGNLRRRSQMLEAFFQHTLTPLVFLDRGFNFVRANKAYAQAAGKEPRSLAGQNYFVLRPHEEDRPIFEQVVRTKQPYFAHAKPFVDPRHPQRPATYWDWRLTPLLGDEGQVQFLVLNLQDVTEAQQAYAALEHRAGQLQKLTLELSQAEDSERKRISELLHEDVQQVLAGAKFHLNLLRQHTKDNERLRQSAEEVAQMLNEAIAKSRSLSHELSPALYEFDLDEMLAWLLRNMAERHGLAVELEVRGPLELPSEPVKALLYKIAQELLFNVVKHAGVRQATLRLRSGRGRLRLTVADRGQGFDRATLAETDGFGLMSIRERIGLLGGRVKIRSAPGRGTLISVALPGDVPSSSAQPK